MRLPLELLIDRYQKNLFAAAYNVCANAQDAEDVVQDTFLQYYSTNKQFNDEEHIKAWLLRVAINKAKDVTRRFRWKNAVSLEDLNEDIPFEDPEVETFKMRLSRGRDLLKERLTEDDDDDRSGKIQKCG